MKNPDEDYARGIRRQAQLDADDTTKTGQWQQKVGTVIPFSKTVDQDPWKYIPLAVGVEQPRWIEALAWAIVAAAVGLVYWLVE